jgi:hypothetical protein
MMGDVRFDEMSESMNTLPKLESRASFSCKSSAELRPYELR